MHKPIKLDLLPDLTSVSQDDKVLREAMEIEIRGLKRAKQAIDEAAETLAEPQSGSAAD